MIPSGISGSDLNFQNGNFTTITQGEAYGSALSDGPCTVELWGKGYQQGDINEHDTIFYGGWHALNDRRGQSGASNMDDVFDDFQSSLHDNHTAIKYDDCSINTSGEPTSQDGPMGGIETAGTTGQIDLVFIGTGIAISNFTNSSDVLVIHVDGIQLAQDDMDDETSRTDYHARLTEFLMVSDLPFGTHTLRFSRVAGGGKSTMSTLRILGPKAPSIPSNALPIAETFLLPGEISDLDLDTEQDELDRLDLWTERGSIRHHTFKELRAPVSEDWDWEGSIPGFNEGPFGRYRTGDQDDSLVFTFYGTEVGAVFEAVSGTASPDVDIDIDGVNVFSGSPASGSADNKVELRFGGLTEGQHELTLTRTTADSADSVTFYGCTTYGRKTFYPYKPNIGAKGHRAIHGNSSWKDLRPLTPHEDLIYSGQLPLNTWHQPRSAVITDRS
jgi:hypothetical protein